MSALETLCWNCERMVPKAEAIEVNARQESGVCLACVNRAGITPAIAEAILPYVWGHNRSRLQRATKAYLATRRLVLRDAR